MIGLDIQQQQQQHAQLPQPQPMIAVQMSGPEMVAMQSQASNHVFVPMGALPSVSAHVGQEQSSVSNIGKNDLQLPSSNETWLPNFGCTCIECSGKLAFVIFLVIVAIGSLIAGVTIVADYLGVTGIGGIGAGFFVIGLVWFLFLHQCLGTNNDASLAVLTFNLCFLYCLIQLGRFLVIDAWIKFELISYTVIQVVSELVICFGCIKYWTTKSANILAARSEAVANESGVELSINSNTGDFFIYCILLLFNMFQSLFLVCSDWLEAEDYESSDKYRITIILCVFVTNVVNIFIGLKSKSVYLFFLHYLQMSAILLVFFIQNAENNTSFFIIIIPVILEYLIIVGAIIYTNKITKSRTKEEMSDESNVWGADITMDSIKHLQYGSIVLFLDITLILMLTLFYSSRNESFILFIINCLVYGFCMFFIDVKAKIHLTGPTYYWLINLLYLQILFQTDYIVCIASFVLLVITWFYYFKYRAVVTKVHLFCQILFILSINYMYSFFTKYVNYWELDNISNGAYNWVYLALQCISFFWIVAVQLLNSQTNNKVMELSGKQSFVFLELFFTPFFVSIAVLSSLPIDW